MQSDTDLVRAVNIGENAAKLLKDELLSGLIFSKKNQACETFLATTENDDKKRRELWQSAQGIISIEQELQALVESGKIAKQELKHLEQAAESDSAIIHNFLKGDKWA